MTCRTLGALVVLVLAAPPLVAQSAKVLLAEGIAAYRDLDLQSADRLLRRALDTTSVAPLKGDDEARALMYLGATNVVLENTDGATSAFRRLILEHPAYRPDTLVFSPRITTVFRQTLEATKVVSVRIPRESRFVVGQQRLPIALVVSSPHAVLVSLTTDAGRALQTVYDGPVHDSLTVAWDGLDADGRPVSSGEYHLRVVSYVTPGTPLRSVIIPLSIHARSATPVTAPEVPDDSLLPESQGGHMRAGLAATSLALGAAALGPVVFGNSTQDAPRIAFGISLTGVGLFALLSRHGEQPVPANIAHNEAVRQRYRDRARQISQENAQRSGQVWLTVRAGPPRHLEGR